MCWRIVRVQGDGTIKIVLADRDNECNEAGYSSTDGQSAFIADPSTYGFTYKYELSSTFDKDNYEYPSVVDSEQVIHLTFVYDCGTYKRVGTPNK